MITESQRSREVRRLGRSHPVSVVTTNSEAASVTSASSLPSSGLHFQDAYPDRHCSRLRVPRGALNRHLSVDGLLALMPAKGSIKRKRQRTEEHRADDPPRPQWA